MGATHSQSDLYITLQLRSIFLGRLSVDGTYLITELGGDAEYHGPPLPPVDMFDSLVLVDLYNKTGDANWKNNSGWFKGPDDVIILGRYMTL